jgi:hypothetical protein
MSKIKKIIKSWQREIQDLGTQGIKASKHKFINTLAELVADELKFGELTEDYLEKYTCVELTKMLNNQFEDETLSSIDQEMNNQIDWLEVNMSIIALLQKRTRHYRLVTGDQTKRLEPSEVDKILNPPKSTKPIKSVTGLSINKWEELHIVVKHISKDIVFQKMIDDKPSPNNEIKKSLSELHLGEKTKELIGFFGHINHGKQISYNSKNNIFKVNKALKELFNKDDNFGVPIKTKDGKISALFHVSFYDANNVLASPNNLHHNAPIDKTNELVSVEEVDVKEYEENLSLNDVEDKNPLLNFKHETKYD